MKLSIIIPAFNEEKELPHCLASVGQALARLAETDPAADNLQAEIIVTDNNSTDATATLARAAGAHVVFEPINQISRARNAGAAAAKGDWLLFIDADSRLHWATLVDLLSAIAAETYAGGGCVIGLAPAPLWGRGLVGCWNLLSRTMKWAAGSFVFCRADAFREIGGFSDELFAAEEVEFSGRLKRWARSQGLKIVILRSQRHVSSGRKAVLYTKREALVFACRILFRGRRALRNPSQLDYFYEGRR
jgi:glycosyltransferase involved in cell wall biosynthesis